MLLAGCLLAFSLSFKFLLHKKVKKIGFVNTLVLDLTLILGSFSIYYDRIGIPLLFENFRPLI